MTYAQNTTVAPEASRMEIERTLRRYGADAFMYMQEGVHQTVGFRADGRYVKFSLTLPSVESFAIAGRRRRTPTQQRQAQEKAERQRWRALLLVIKAKLEAVEAGIETFEVAFMPYLVLPDQTTVGEWLGPQIEEAYATGVMPGGIRALLTAGDGDG